MSALKIARQYYVGQAGCFNPLWQHIGPAFQEWLLSKVGDQNFSPQLYVPTRLENGGVAEEALRQYVDTRTERLLVLEGWAGVGKTTLLWRVFSDQMSTSDARVVWIDVMRDIAELEPPLFVDKILRLIGNGLREEVERRGRLVDWWRFFVENAPDSLGARAMLLALLGRDGLSLAFFDSVMKFMGSKSDPLMDVRLLIRFLEECLGRRSIVILDNSDQLPSEMLSTLAKLGVQLAEGSPQIRGSSTLGPSGAATVVLALRPSSWASLTFGTTPIWKAQVAPPKIQEVLAKRLALFLTDYDGRLMRSSQLRLGSPARTLDLREFGGEEGETLPALARRWIETLAGVVTDAEPFGQMIARTQELLNYNTRMVLIATAGYIASGHLEFEALLRSVPRGRVSARKAFGAMMLGTNSIYSSGSRNGSWLLNVFNDGTADRVGVLLRLRVLKLLVRAKELRRIFQAADVAQALCELFGLDEARVADCLFRFRALGLVQDDGSSGLSVTPGGECYLRVLVRDFEYLQHVAIDVHVDAKFLVECVARDEPAFTRFRRVVLLGEWVRELEIRDLAVVKDHEASLEYRLWFEDDTICSTVASVLEGIAPHLPRGKVSEANWTELINRASELRRSGEIAALWRATAGPIDAH